MKVDFTVGSCDSDVTLELEVTKKEFEFLEMLRDKLDEEKGGRGVTYPCVYLIVEKGDRKE